MPKAKVRTFSATDRDVAMLESIARYHGLNKSATITSLIRKEFWRIFPAGTDKVKPDRGARVEEKEEVEVRTGAENVSRKRASRHG